MENNIEFNKLAELAKPITEYLGNKLNPYAKIVITNESIYIEETVLGIPIKQTAAD